MVVLMADEHALTCPSQAADLIIFLQPLQSRKHRRVLFGLGILGTEGVVAEGIQADGLGLVAVEVFGKDRAAVT